ncbi:hypothetical protein EUGRSUZ_F00897 [Eucalyptus grandis]|uniref:Uncharacterized protein n=2 Tax=Eucalyptus grandis TaxID=71139 RepID=A0ACC3KDI2_EUCGR|nr:hypothetical protein EUGRSUZ_F00897 [Eucalyptus grandis]
MAETARSTNRKRPVCPSCSKPARTCLCARIHSPGLDHPVRVTVLQHSLERKHPLNSTRILRLGLKNVAVAAVSDVNFGAEFSISPLQPHAKIGAHGLVGEDLGVQNGEQSGVAVGNPSSVVESNGAHCPREDRNYGSIASNGVEVSEDSQALQNSRACGVVSRGTSKPVISFRMGKNGIIESTDHVWMSRIDHQGADFDAILDCQSARDVLSNGFVVRKSHNLVSNLSLEPKEYKEFVLEVPRGSVLLFLTENALSIDELKAAEFEVRNLIVLDGTWMKAKRMYSENPWLKLLPHLKLDLEFSKAKVFIVSYHKNPRPEWSVFREAGFGHGELKVVNSTHAFWSWHGNDDDDEPVRSDQLRITSLESLGCLAEKKHSLRNILMAPWYWR